MKEWIGRAALVVAAIVFSLGLLEIGLRLTRGWDGLTHWPNLVVEARQATMARGTASRAVHDPRLGFVGRPGYRSNDGALTYDDKGRRVVPAPVGVALAEPPILVVGDSFAHGDDVRDAETWPARLQGLLGRRVVNAAMSGHGIDQMMLRAETVAPEVKPAAIVMSFIFDDVRRAEMRRVWGIDKPYLELVHDETGDRLVERNMPVPSNPDPRRTLDVWQRLFGWSVLLDSVLEALGWRYEWVLDHVRVMPRGSGEKLACPLFKRLAALGAPVLVVAEHDAYHWQDESWRAVTRRTDDAVLDCARAAGLHTLDLFETIDAAVKQQGLTAIFQRGHPTAAGTAVAAERIAQELRGILK